MRYTKALVPVLLVAVSSVPARAQDPRVAEAVQKVDAVAARGPFAPSWASLEKFQAPAVVPGRQVRHLHPLGRLLRARLRQRVVPAQHVPAGRRRSSRTTSRPTARSRSSATRTSSRMFKAEKFDAAALGARSSRRPARSTSCRWPSTTTASPCTTAASPTGARRRWGRSATSSASWPQAVRGRGAGLRRLLATAPSTGGSSTAA